MNREEVAKKERRGLLKLILFGGGAFVLGKTLGPLTNFFSDQVINELQFKNFKFVETEKKITISEMNGEDLLVVEKESL